ncbi:tetratricopeptide repeat protein [Ruminiclostridium sufflavum]|nr:tetratricopeptide repeat protein [Ruminiclostridium sufflavum]
MNLKFTNHKDSKNEKKQIWIYALILFTGAFIVLLLTAYSQVKFQNNISEYQSKLSTEEKAKINVVTDYNAAVKEIDRLTDEVESLRNKLVESEQSLASEESKGLELNTKYTDTIVCNDLLLTAYEDYNKSDYINCAIKLKYDINTALLSTKSKELYDDLVSKSFKKVSQSLYTEGYRSYKNKKYDDAIQSLSRTIDFAQKDDYFVDDAYFYLAKSYYKTEKYNEAKTLISSFIDIYPDSTFVDLMKELYNKMI